jgi:hypothetical protein
VEGVFLPLRVHAVGEWHITMVAGPPISAFQIQRALALLEAHGVELSASGLRSQAHLVGRLWEMMLERSKQLVRMTNTDGDALVWQTATFRVADVNALASALEKQSGVEYDEDDGAWVWSRPGGPAPGVGNNTLLGRLEMMDDRLVLEVNSLQRLANARAWIERLPGVRFERATARDLKPEGRPLDDALPARREVVSPEMLAAFEEINRKLAFDWLDTPIPMLGGQTPRQACKHAEGRRQVEVLVRTMADMEYPGGSIPAPREELLRELGIATRTTGAG